MTVPLDPIWTLRDEFAVRLIPPLLNALAQTGSTEQFTIQHITDLAYQYADACLEMRRYFRPKDLS